MSSFLFSSGSRDLDTTISEGSIVGICNLDFSCRSYSLTHFLSCLVCVYVSLSLTNHQLVVLGKVVGWDFQVQRSGSLSYTARDIVVRTVARAEPTTEITGFTNGDTSQMCAHTQHDEPFGFLYSIAIALRITEGFNSIGGGG